MNSSRDMLQLIAELHIRRMPMVFGRWYKSLSGKRFVSEAGNVQLLLSKMTREELESYKTVRGMHDRYSKGNFSHTMVELSQVMAFCRFLVRLNAELQHQTPREFEIDLSKMATAEDLPRDAYRTAMDIVQVM